MRLVWSEALDQARQMVGTWTTPVASTEGICSVAKDTRTLSLNVLAATGFRRSFSFQSSTEYEKDSDTASSYRDALSIVLDNVILLMLIPRRYLCYPFLPKSLQRIGQAAESFKHHMQRMLDEETAALKQGKPGTGGLMTSFVKASDAHEVQSDGTRMPQGLSVEEIYGNIFVINFAGHDTTANTLAFIIYLLASNPEVQDWLVEELDHVLPSSAPSSWDYATIFPHLLRCRAVLVSSVLQLQFHMNTKSLSSTARNPPPLPTHPLPSQTYILHPPNAVSPFPQT